MKIQDFLLDKICWKLKIGKPYCVSFPRFKWWPNPIKHSLEDISKWLEDNADKDEWTTRIDGFWRRYYFKDKDKALMFKVIWG